MSQHVNSSVYSLLLTNSSSSQVTCDSTERRFLTGNVLIARNQPSHNALVIIGEATFLEFVKNVRIDL